MQGDSRSILTDRYDCDASSHQVKGKFASQNCQLISVSKLHLSHGFQWLLLTATMVEI